MEEDVGKITEGYLYEVSLDECQRNSFLSKELREIGL